MRRISREPGAVELGRDDAVLVGRLREHDAPRIDDHRAAVARLAALGAAPLVRRGDEALVLDRAGAEQQLPVVLAGRERERGRHGDELGAVDGEAPVELGEAQVVADGQPDAASPRPRRRPSPRRAPRPRTRGRPARRPRRRRGGSCGRRRRSRRRESNDDARVRELLAPLARLGDRAADDREPCRRAQPASAATVSPPSSGSAAARIISVEPIRVPLLRQDDEVGAGRGRLGRRAARRSRGCPP